MPCRIYTCIGEVVDAVSFIGCNGTAEGMVAPFLLFYLFIYLLFIIIIYFLRLICWA